MNTIAGLLEELRAAIRRHDFGLVTVRGDLSGWRTTRHGRAFAELVDGEIRLPLAATAAAARSATDTLSCAGRLVGEAGPVTVHGHLTVDNRWGLQLQLLRLTIVDDTSPGTDIVSSRPNHARRVPDTITVVGLVAPAGGDDARNDVLTQLAATTLTIMEHRVSFTGVGADLSISRALDRLALNEHIDITLVVRGGGPSADFAPFNSPIVIAAIDRHSHPVITGLGHANNHTAADTAAHTAAITPTAAAQVVLDQNRCRPLALDQKAQAAVTPSSVGSRPSV